LRQEIYAAGYLCMADPHAREFDFCIREWDDMEVISVAAVCRDPKNNFLLAVAMDCKANCLPLTKTYPI
jgi:hypothetical protein